MPDLFLVVICVAGFTLSYMSDAQRGLWGLCPGYEAGRVIYILNWHFPILARHVLPVVLIVQLILLPFSVQTPIWLWAISLGGVVGDIDYVVRPN